MISGISILSSWSSSVPDSILDKSRMSLMRLSKWCPDSWISFVYSRYLGLPTGPKVSFLMISEKPMIAFRGVRSSWLIRGEEFGLGAVGGFGLVARDAKVVRQADQGYALHVKLELGHLKLVNTFAQERL